MNCRFVTSLPGQDDRPAGFSFLFLHQFIAFLNMSSWVHFSKLSTWYLCVNPNRFILGYSVPLSSSFSDDSVLRSLSRQDLMSKNTLTWKKFDGPEYP